MFIVSSAVWALTDDRAGHNAHTLGIAEHLGIEYQEKKLRFNALSKLPSTLLGDSLTSLETDSRALIEPPFPALVIASGRRMIPVMRHIKKEAPKTKLLQCLWPGTLEPFDTISAPEHDRLPNDPRIITYRGALHGLTEKKLQNAVFTFQSLFDNLPKPHFGLLIGGNSSGRKAKLDDLHHMLDTAEFLAKDGSLIITTSRRTPAHFAEAIRERLTCPYHLHEWGGAAPNPYYGMLALCDALVVSGDSLSMISEACFTGKPVLIDETFHSMRAKHRRACESLIWNGHAFSLRANLDLEALKPVSLNETQRLAPLLKAHLKL